MGDYPYNVAGASIVFGILLMLALEASVHFFVDKQLNRAALGKASSKQHVAEALECSNVQGTMLHDSQTYVCVAHQPHTPVIINAKTRRDRVRRSPRA